MKIEVGLTREARQHLDSAAFEVSAGAENIAQEIRAAQTNALLLAAAVCCALMLVARALYSLNTGGVSR